MVRWSTKLILPNSFVSTSRAAKVTFFWGWRVDGLNHPYLRHQVLPGRRPSRAQFRMKTFIGLGRGGTSACLVLRGGSGGVSNHENVSVVRWINIKKGHTLILWPKRRVDDWCHLGPLRMIYDLSTLAPLSSYCTAVCTTYCHAVESSLSPVIMLLRW